jgi:hypothetical protein
LITRTIFSEEYKSLSSSLCSFLYSRVTSSALVSNIFLGTLFSNTLSLRVSLNVSDHVSNPYKTTGKIIVLYISIVIFWDKKRERFCTDCWKAIPDFSLLLRFSWIEFWFVRVVPKYFNCSTLSNELLSIFMWLRPVFWFRDMTMYLALSAFTSSPLSLPASTKASLFFFIVCTLPPEASKHYQH